MRPYYLGGADDTILLVQAGENATLLHSYADIDGAGDKLARDPETEVAFLSRLDLADGLAVEEVERQGLDVVEEVLAQAVQSFLRQRRHDAVAPPAGEPHND